MADRFALLQVVMSPRKRCPLPTGQSSHFQSIVSSVPWSLRTELKQRHEVVLGLRLLYGVSKRGTHRPNIFLMPKISCRI